MHAFKQYIWLVLLIGAGAVIAWFVMPPQRRNMPGLLLGCAALVAILVFSGCRRSERAIQPDKYKARYFARCLRYDMTDGQTLVTDNRSPRVITLDPWLEVIFAAADGQRTAQQFVTDLAAQYPGGAPSALDAQTYQLLAKMEAEGLIRFSDQPIKLPYYLSMPSSQQDKDRALSEMKKDGYIK
jgi:hypothetical protein